MKNVVISPPRTEEMLPFWAHDYFNLVRAVGWQFIGMFGIVFLSYMNELKLQIWLYMIIFAPNY
jgi:hypothetical protein